MKRVYLHIGSMKTGTTSIQNFCDTESEFLVKNNIYYPKNTNSLPLIYKFDSLFHQSNKYAEVHSFLEQENLTFSEFQEQLHSFWETEFKKAEALGVSNFVISSEFLSLILVGPLQIMEIKNYLKQYFDEIVVVAYIRDFSSWLPSKLQEDIKGGFLQNITDEAINFTTTSAYLPFLDTWITEFNNIDNCTIIIKDWLDSQGLNNKNIVQDFISIINPDILFNNIESPKFNESLSMDSTVFLYRLNQKYPRLINGQLNFNRGLVDRKIPFKLYKDDSNKFDINLNLPTASKNHVEHIYNTVNAFLGEELFKLEETFSNVELLDNHIISDDFYTELINEYNKEIGALLKTLEKKDKEITELKDKLKMFNNKC